MMNARAKQLGLTKSHFVNPDGLPDPPGQMMSVMDLAKLARHLIYDYPQYYHYFAERSFTQDVGNGRSITQQNRDSVLDKFPGTDGLKTGHTDAAGYGITVSAVQNGHRLILVLNGLRYPQLDKMTPAAQDWHGVQLRGDEAARLMCVAFREFRQYALFKPGDSVGQAQVWQGESNNVPLTVNTPKPMLEVAGVPFLSHQLARAKAAGIDRIVFATAYKPEVFEEYFGDGSRFGLELVDLGSALQDTEFKVFKSVLEGGGSIRGINAGKREVPRKELDGFISRAQELGAKGLVWLGPFRRTSGFCSGPGAGGQSSLGNSGG